MNSVRKPWQFNESPVCAIHLEAGMKPLNIQMFVDAAALLSGCAVSETFFLFDDNPASRSKGTSRLSSACYPGQLIRWYLTPIDVQTPVWIKAIQFSQGLAAALPGRPEASTGSVLDSQEAAAPAKADLGLSESVARIALDKAQCGPWGFVWSGYVPAWVLPDHPYRYDIQFVFGGGQSTAFAVGGPSLVYPICLCASEESSTDAL
jgi:hypothetical protein